jgi:light-regulated signal transduction histidine kinase (bacteriophytochrome)
MALGRPINGTPSSVVVEFPDQVFFSQARRFLRRMVLIKFVLLALGVAGAFVLSRSFTRPLQSLTEAASAVSNGDYSAKVDIRRQDELGALANAFNAMVIKTLESQRDLEHRVADRTAQLQAANKELEAFSYSVSHDLRAPLRHINGFSQALLEDYSDKLDDAGKNYLQQVRNASQEMAQLIDDVLQLARVTRSEMRKEFVNLSELAGGVVADLQKMERRPHLTVTIEAGLSAQGDKRLLRIVLANLLGNAWKFTSQRKDAEITFGEARQNGETFYFVRDNGAGFDMTYANKLFGAFQRLHTAGEFEGTGIGLATVQRIIHRHGGRVWAEGETNKGATFYFTLLNSEESGDGQQSDLTGGR